MATDMSIQSVSTFSPTREGGSAVSAPGVVAPAGESVRPDAAAASPQNRDSVSLEEVVNNMKVHAASARAELDFRIDEDSGQVVVSVVDRNDGSVLRQIPSEEALRIAKAVSDYVPALIEADA